MNTNKKANQSTKKNMVLPITILVVVLSLIVIVFQLANNNFDFVDFIMRLHGG